MSYSTTKKWKFDWLEIEVGADKALLMMISLEEDAADHMSNVLVEILRVNFCTSRAINSLGKKGG